MRPDHCQTERMMEERVKDGLRQPGRDPVAQMASVLQELRPRHLPLHFIVGCQEDTSAQRWEPMIGLELYGRWRDALIEVGWAEWIDSHAQERGWRLARPTSEIMEMVFLV